MTFNWLKKRSTATHSPLSAMEAAIHAAQGCDAVQITGNTSADVFPITAEQQRQKEQQKQQAEEALRNPLPGTLVPGQGIFLCKYTPVDETEKSLRKTFNVYAAPEDLTDEWGRWCRNHYNGTVWRMSTLRDWHGYNGANYRDDAEFYSALKNGSYHGEWVIPTHNLLRGTAPDGSSITCPDNLFTHQNTDAFIKTFKDLKESADDWALYWSCTAELKNGNTFIKAVHFVIGGSKWVDPYNIYARCRPVRLVEVSPV